MFLVYLSLTWYWHLSFLCRAEEFNVWDVQVRALVCSIFSFDMGEQKCQKCAYGGFMCSKAGKISAVIQGSCVMERSRIFEHSRALPLPVFFYFLSCFLDEIPAKSLLCGGESVGMLCAYSLDFKILMHKEGLTVRASDSVQPSAFLLNLFYVQC